MVLKVKELTAAIRVVVWTPRIAGLVAVDFCRIEATAVEGLGDYRIAGAVTLHFPMSDRFRLKIDYIQEFNISVQVSRGLVRADFPSHSCAQAVGGYLPRANTHTALVSPEQNQPTGRLSRIVSNLPLLHESEELIEGG